jgi:hypothetical protein
MGFIKDILKTKLADRVEERARNNEDSISPAVEVMAYKPVDPGPRGMIKGLISIRFPKLYGLEIHSLALHQSTTTGNRWLRYPSRPILVDGRVVKWEPHLTFDSKKEERNFQDLVIRELDVFCATWPRWKRGSR